MLSLGPVMILVLESNTTFPKFLHIICASMPTPYYVVQMMGEVMQQIQPAANIHDH